MLNDSTNTDLCFRRTLKKVVKCGKLFLKALVLQQVELSKPKNSCSESVLDEFLNNHKNRIESSSNISGTQLYIFFPNKCTHTNLDDWDFGMLYYVLRKLCILGKEIEHNLESFRDFRDKLLDLENNFVNEAQYLLFEGRFNELMDAFKSLVNDDQLQLKINTIVKEIDGICTIDFAIYIEDRDQLLNWRKNDADLLKDVHNEQSKF